MELSTFLICVRAFRDPLGGDDGPNPLTWDAQLLSYLFSRNASLFQDWFVNVINNLWVVTVLDCPGRGASQVEKSPRLNWVTQFLTAAYDDACFPNVSIRMAWISFGALPCRKKKLDDSSRLSVVEITRVPDLLLFCLCNKKRLAIRQMNRPLFSNDTIHSMWWRTGGKMKGKLANAVGSQYPSHYLGTWCIQHYYRWCAHLGCQ